MFELWNSMTDGFMPHGACLRWDAALLCAFIVGNLGIALAYFLIPSALRYFIGKRKDLPYPHMFRRVYSLLRINSYRQGVDSLSARLLDRGGFRFMDGWCLALDCSAIVSIDSASVAVAQPKRVGRIEQSTSKADSRD